MNLDGVWGEPPLPPPPQPAMKANAIIQTIRAFTSAAPNVKRLSARLTPSRALVQHRRRMLPPTDRYGEIWIPLTNGRFSPTATVDCNGPRRPSIGDSNPLSGGSHDE